MAASKVSDLTLGKFLKIVSQGAVYNNLSEDSAMWDYIKKKRKGDSEGRQLQFLLRSTYGASAAAFVPADGGDYPTASQGGINEGITQYKDFALTIEVERTLIAKALSDMSRYGEPLAEEMRAKTIAMSRILSASVYQDGSGIIGKVLSTGTIADGELPVNLDHDDGKSFVGWFELGDKIVCTNDAGTLQATTVSAGTVAYYVVENKDRANAQITIGAYDASDAKLTITAANDIGAADWFYRKGIYDDTGTIHPGSFALGTDLNTLSSNWVGLEGLTLTDGQKVNDIDLSGALGGTRIDVDNQPIDSKNFQNVLSQLMIKVGQGRYKYDSAMMAWESYDALVESRETDRRFNSIQDNKRGVAQLGYVHAKNTIIFEPDEFCPSKKIYIPPNADVLQFRGSDFDYVRPDGGSKFFLANASSGQGHARRVRAYMEGQGALMCIHPAAIGVLTNFTV
jgi:hypothetical protein